MYRPTRPIGGVLTYALRIEPMSAVVRIEIFPGRDLAWLAGLIDWAVRTRQCNLI